MKTNLTPDMLVKRLAVTVFLLLGFILFSFSHLAAQNQPLPSAGTGFTENKGQFTDTEGKPVEDVFFKMGTNGLDIYVTKTGLDYVFYRIPEEEGHEQEEKEKAEKRAKNIEWKKEENIRKEMNHKVEWCMQKMILSGADIRRENIITSQQTAGEKNYYFPFCPDGILHVKTWQKVLIRSVYPGIDWVIYTSGENGIKYDFIVHPGADVSDIVMEYKGAGKIFPAGENKKLVISTPLGEITEGKLEAFSENGEKVNAILQMEENRVTFSIGDYDKNQKLVIDPPLVWSTYYGGGVLDGTRNVITDASGNVFLVGYSTSTNYPAVNAGGGSWFQGTSGVLGSAIMMKFSPSGAIIWATYYGGNTNYSNAKSMCLDAAGDLYVAGETGATNFPTYDPGNGAFFQSANNTLPGNISEDIFIIRFDNNGIRKWATYFGGDMQELAEACIIDGNGNLLITGTVNSSNFPLMNPGGGAYYQPVNGGGFDMLIAKFNTSDNSLVWSTNYGGNGGERGQGFEKDAAGNIFLVGCSGSTSGMYTVNPGGGAYFQGTNGGGFYDIFLLRMNSAGSIQWATFFGGAGMDYGLSIKKAECGTGYFVTGTTSSLNFPLLNMGGGAYYQNTYGGGVNDMFLLKFDAGLGLDWSTYLGGNNSETAFGTLNCNRLTTDSNGNLYLVGGTFSNNFPVVNPGGGSYFQGSFGGVQDIMICRFNSSGVLDWSTYFGGPNGETAAGIFMDPSGSLYVAGEYTNTGAITANPGGGAYFGSYGGSDDIGISKFMATNTALTYTTLVEDVSCFGANDGSVIISVNGGVPGYSFQWNSGQTNDTVTGLPAGNYSITVTDSDTSACLSQGNQLVINVTVNEPPAISVSVTQNDIICSSQCIGDASAAATGGVGSFSYVWTPGGMTTPFINNLCAGPYTVIAADASGCTDTANITIQQTTGTLSYTVFSSSVSCYGLTDGSAGINVSGGSGSYLYSWLPGGEMTSSLSNIPAGNYTVNVTDTNGCSASAVISVLQPDSISLSLADSADACLGVAVPISSNASGGTGTLSYAWENGNTSGSFSLTAPVTGFFTVTVTDSNNCSVSDSLWIDVHPLPQIAILPVSSSGCDEVCVSFSSTSSVPPVTYNWTFSNGIVSSLSNPQVCFDTPGTFNATLQVTDINGCSGSYTETGVATVYPSPQASFTLSETELSDYNPNTVIINTSSGSTSGSVFTGQWQGFVNLPPGQDMMVSYTDTGYFMITLIASNSFGCTDTTSQYVHVTPEIAIFVPNTFTPDGDGINDVFTATGININDFKMYIFNRWGELIFTSENLYYGWSGVPDGGNEVAQIDTYVYKIFYKDYSNMPHSFIGHVNLVK
ncbi:MAG: SBBP repeat-containing protein [Bacteroidota bacterium]